MFLSTKPPREDKRGSYRFVIFNLDPLDENLDQVATDMLPYLKGDNSYHFTLYLPAVWSACTIYVNSTLLESVGEIADYNYINYSNYIGETVYHKTKTEPLFIDLSFYSRRESLPISKPIIAAKIVTVHFESEQGSFGGLNGMPLIGTEEAVRGAVGQSKTLLSSVALISALILAIFVFLCFLKRTLRYLPQQLFVLGILGTLFSANALLAATSLPYLLSSAKTLFFALIPLATILSLRVKIKKYPIWIPCAGFAFLVCIFEAIIPFLGVSISTITICQMVLFCVECAMILSIAVIAYSKNTTRPMMLINPMLASVLVIGKAFLPNTIFFITSPLFWLMFATLVVSVITSFYAFFDLERKNRYLTANLQNEVSRQTQELQSIITERDKFLGRVSHDMKKPVRSIRQFISVLETRESDTEQLKTIGILTQKTDALLSEFDELGSYAKLNYAAEISSPFDVVTVLEQVHDSLNPDCVANGIVFRMTAPHIVAYAKPKCLCSVLNNLIINALEHSGCSQIRLSATKKKGFCHFKVTDNGKGIDEGKNIFQPYYSENDSADNVGLGLYICKSLIGSMGGELLYHQEEGELTFTVTLPLS